MYFLIMTDIYEGHGSKFFDKLDNTVQVYTDGNRRLDWKSHYPELRCTNLQLEAYIRNDIETFQRLKEGDTKQTYHYGLITANTMAANLFRLLMLEEIIIPAECVYVFHENGIIDSNFFNAYGNFREVNNEILDIEMNLAAKLLKLQAQKRKSMRS